MGINVVIQRAVIIHMPDRCPTGLCKHRPQPPSFVHWGVHSVHHSKWGGGGETQYEKRLLLLERCRHVGSKHPVQTAVTQSSRHSTPPSSLPPTTTPDIWIENPLHLFYCVITRGNPPNSVPLLCNPPTPKFLLYSTIHFLLLSILLCPSAIFSLRVSQRDCQQCNNRNLALFDERPVCCHWVSFDSRGHTATTNGSVLDKQRDKKSSRNCW